MRHPDDECGPVATYSEAFKEYARNAGHERPDEEWISTPWDTWEKNPWYSGKPGRHPEDDYDPNEDAGAVVADMNEDFDPRYPPGDVMPLGPRASKEFLDDDIPF